MTTSTTRSIGLALTLAIAVAPVAQGQQAPPEPGTPEPFTLPDPREFTLSNGLAVTLVPYGNIPKVNVALVTRAGNVNEGPREVWLADLAGDLMEEGTTTRTGPEIARTAAEMGGEVSIGVTADVTQISGTALSDFAPEMVRLVADLAINPAFPASELDRLKESRIRQIAIAKSRPQSLALEKFRAVVYPEHPYGRTFPTPEMIQGYTVEQLRGFHQRHFGAANSRLYIVGRYDAAAVEQAVRDAFAAMPRGMASTPSVPQPTTEREVHLVDRPGSVQSTLYLGLPVVDPSHPDYIPLVVTNTLLGGYFSSRITSNIREQKGYTYSPGSLLSTRYRDTYWAQTADVTTNVTGPSLKEIFYEIDRLQAEPPPPEELQAVQNYLAGTFVLQNSSRPGILSQLQFLDLHGLSEEWLQRYVPRVQAVTPQDVQRIARTYLDDERMTIVVVGDRAAIEEQIKPYGSLVP